MSATGGVRRGADRERIPRLTTRFVLWTAFGLTVAAAVVFVLVRRELTLQAERETVSRAELASHILGRGIRRSDLRAPAGRSRRRRLDLLFEHAVLVGGPLRGSLVGAGGTILYSTDHALIGRAVAGTTSPRVTSRIVEDDALGRALEVSVPLTIDARHIVGTVRLDQPYAPLEAAARRTSLEIAGVVELLFLVLLAALVPALNGASTRIRRDLDELDHLATHDALLGVPNRLGLERCFGRVDERAGSPLIVDLVAFGEVNDALGPAWGNALLSRWASRLDPTPLGCELIARLGEDELCLISPIANRDEVARLVDRIREALATPVELDGLEVALEASIGIALIPEHGRNLDTVLRRAGVALTRAKVAADRVAVFDPSDDATQSMHLRRTAELREALARGELAVHYQPQADLGTRAIRGVEALVRWHHPREGLLEAGRFIGAAERSGLITQLDRFVLERMTEQWRAWNHLGIEIDIAANLAPVDLLDAALPDEIAAIIDRYELDPDRLVLEITELAVVHDDHRTREVLTRLRGLGVRLSIDDYGTGYSSLAYLRRLPVQQVKLDRSFIEKLPESAADRAIVRSTAELAHTLGATVVAEGIETEEQWIAAARQGCDIAQGYLIARALPADRMTELLLAGPSAQGRRVGRPTAVRSAV